MTKLKTPLRRELQIGKSPYVVTVSAETLKLVAKGKRNGLEIKWVDLISGDAVMAVALRASLTMPKASNKAAPKKRNTQSKSRRTKSPGKRSPLSIVK